mgnify:CR=1 FL=1
MGERVCVLRLYVSEEAESGRAASRQPASRGKVYAGKPQLVQIKHQHRTTPHRNARSSGESFYICAVSTLRSSSSSSSSPTSLPPEFHMWAENKWGRLGVRGVAGQGPNLLINFDLYTATLCSTCSS